MHRLYLDASPVIYLVERVPAFHLPIRALLSERTPVIASSHLTVMECKVVPVRNHDALLAAAFDDFFSKAVGIMVPLSAGVFERATAIRARYDFRTPDAIHLAAAMAAGCDEFLTNDKGLASFKELPVLLVDDLVAAAQAAIEAEKGENTRDR